MNVDDIALSFVDEHATAIAAPRDLVWPVLRRWAGSIGFGERNPLATLWAAEPRTGFEVSREVVNQQITMTGRHRFSRYALVFELTDLPDDSTRLAARTYAEFPGARGLSRPGHRHPAARGCHDVHAPLRPAPEHVSHATMRKTARKLPTRVENSASRST